MNIPKRWLILVAVVAIGLMGFASSGFAIHPDVDLKDSLGNPLGATSTAPYSPKMTCGAPNGTCHNSFTADGGHNYESDVTTAYKDHGPGTTSYGVPYPQHGVSAGYHFQQGRNIPWGQTQRDFYGLSDFTSSPGMYGKY